jgi:hypothetical protein
MSPLAVFVVSAGLVGGSFKILEPLEYGILQNTISKDLTTGKVYTGGRFFVGLGKDFIRFPRPRRIMSFGLHSGTDAGPINAQVNPGQVQVEASLTYALNYTNLISLYRNFGTNYHSRFVSLVASALQQSYSDGLNSTDFFTNRAMIAQKSLLACKAVLEPLVSVIDFQLRGVALPSTTETQIISKLVSAQKALTAANVQQQTQLNAQINVVVGQIQQEIDLYQANQTQYANIISNQAVSSAKQLQLSSSAVAYTAFLEVLNFNNSELLQYLYIKNTKSAPDRSRLAVGFDTLALWKS